MTPSFRRIATMVFGALGTASPAFAAPVQKAVAPEAAPPSWVAYAEQVNQLVTGWLGGDEPAALELRTGIDATRAADDQSSAPITLRLWIDAKGIITQVEADPAAPEAVMPNLRTLLVGRVIGMPPPRGMLLPLRLAVQLDPAPPEAGE